MSIIIRHLNKHYREGDVDHSVLSDLSATLAEGEVVALLGSSGCGKSTLLNLIGGLDRPDSGQIMVAGQDIVALSEAERTRWRRRDVGLVFQFFNLIPTLTVAENARLPLALNQRDTPAERQRAVELLSRVGLGQRLDSYPEQLSGGQQQRLAIIRALVHQPRLLLADEPTGNLDETTGEQVLNLLLELVRPLSTTVLLVTHDRSIAQRTDRILELHNGRLSEPPATA
jgi:putative ABC transport system ATP-binding protein